MNTEYALVNLLVKDPTQFSELLSRGFNGKFFKNKDFRKAYEMVFDRWTRFQSIPTEDDFATINFKPSDEPVPYSLEHCITAIHDARVKDIIQAGLIQAGNQLITEGPSPTLEMLRHIVSKIPSLDNERRFANISETTDAFLARYHSRALNKGKMLGLPMGFPKLDMHIRGLMPQWLVVIQGRNKQGKTFILSHMVKTMYLEKKNIALFSCEMSYEAIESRLHALVMGVPPREIDFGELRSGDYNRMQEYLEEVKVGKAGGQLIIDDNPIDLTNIALKIDRILDRYPLDVIFIDAAYELEASGQSEREKFANIASGCKALARQYNVPVVITIQANREFQKANMGGKKETSGSGMSGYGTDKWNQVADLVFLLHSTPEHVPFHYKDFIMDAFRHGPPLDSMIHMNIKEPVIEEVDRDRALARMQGEDPTAQSVSDSVFQQSTSLYNAEPVQPAHSSYGEELHENG